MGERAQVTAIDEALATARTAGRLPVWVPALAAVALASALGAVFAASSGSPVSAWLVASTAILGATALGGLVVRQVRLSRAAWLLGDLARADSESGLLAPHALWHDLAAHLDPGQPTMRPLSVVMVTIDELRTLHVERGLAAGQQLMRQVASALESTVAPHGGRAYRAHGTALVAVLPDTTHAQAERIAQKLAPVLRLLSKRNGNLVALHAGGAVALAGDLPEDLVQRAERRCQKARAGITDELGQVLRPLTTH